MKVRNLCLSFIILLLATIAGVSYISTPLVLSWIFAKISGDPSPANFVESYETYVPSENVLLQTEHFYPYGANLSLPQYPTILIRTAYGTKVAHGLLATLYQINSHYLASFGYNVILQNIRGRFNSSGEWNPLIHEKTDGYATLNWLKKQPWFNGKLGTLGSSYVGYTQFSLFGKDTPVEISASVPVVTGTTFYDFAHKHGAPCLDPSVAWSLLLHHSSEKNPSFLESMWESIKFLKTMRTEYYEEVTQVVPLIEADVKSVGHELRAFQDIIKNTNADDEYWTSRDRTAQLADSKSGTIHLVGSWHDIFTSETFDTYDRLVKLGKKPRLTMYGGDHIDMGHSFYAYSLNWFDHHLKGEKLKPSKPVRILINPTSEWVELDSWPPATTPSPFYFHSAGKLSAKPVVEGEKEIYKYIYDPEKPTPVVGGYLLIEGGPKDNQPFLDERVTKYNDVIVFTSPVFEKDTTIVGKVTAKLYVSSSLANTDFYVRIFDHDPAKNTTVNIADGFERLSKKELTTDVIEVEITTENTSYRFSSGRALRVMVASGAHPHISRNPGSGEHINTATKFFKAEQQFYVSKEYPSQLTLPVFKN